ncbi:MAG TPA: aldehyde dehydrogenase family protein, partial [Pseudonocardiaceae bacterium]|nr:aldehyde dehydrogenase family protein [Pseudonocardiaceae bacterium]
FHQGQVCESGTRLLVPESIHDEFVEKLVARARQIKIGDAMDYDTEDEAVEIANATVYGLAGAVFSGDEDRAMAVAARMRTGQVDVNAGAFNPVAPFGGYKQSGNGRELGRFGLEEFCEVKSIQRPVKR